MLRIRSLLLMLMVATSVWAQGLMYNIGVDGLACPFCVHGIEKQLHKLDGVEKVETDIEQGRVLAKMQEGKTLERDQVEKAVKKAGFSLRSFEQHEEEETP